MCGRYLRRSDKQRIAEAFDLGKLPSDFVLPPWDYNVAPTSHQPVIRQSRETHERELVLMRWGLVPHFAKSAKDFAFSTINAQAETLLAKPTFRVPFERRRCLVLADGFYEWKLLPPPAAPDLPPTGRKPAAPKPVRQPYAFTLKDDAPFAFAGLWDAWKDSATGEWLQSYTIITTDPNELTAQVHTRMPVILAPADYDRWLARPESGTRITDPAHQLPLDLLRPYPADKMKAARAHLDVGNVRNNHPGLLNSA